MTPPASFDVVVLGAGLVGAACAAELTGAGLRVALVDRSFPGSGSSGAAMGHIVVMDDSPAQLALTAWSRSLWHAMVPGLHEDAEVERRGTLWIAVTEEEMAAATAKRTVLAGVGVDSSILTAGQLAQEEPSLRRGLAGALLVPDDLVLYPPAVARRLSERAAAAGAELFLGAQAVELHDDQVAVTDAVGARHELRAPNVVVAAGIDSPLLVPGLPVMPRKGHLVITDRVPGLVRHQLVELGYLHSAHTLGGPSVAFNIQPRSTGQLLIGSSRELVGRDPSINRTVLAAMLQRAAEFVPSIDRCPATRAWTGFRPATPDALPLIGRWPARAGLWIATGHEGLGITLAPATARLIRAGICGESLPLDPAPFRPDRPMPPLHAAAA